MKYMTYIETLHSNAERHKLRGLLYSMLGQHSHAAGSYIKMLRNRRRANNILFSHRILKAT